MRTADDFERFFVSHRMLNLLPIGAST